MGLGKITRTGGKVAAALQVGLLLVDLGASIVNRLRGRSKDQPPDDTRGVEQADADRGDGESGDHERLQP